MDAAAQAARLDGVLEVQHLVVEQVLDGVARAGGAVEDAADDDGVVGGVVMAERALGVVLAPGEVGAAEQPAEKARVERVEDLFEMKVAAFRAEVALAAARRADELGLARDGGRGGEALVAQVVRGVDGLAIELGKKDVRDGVEDGFRRAFKQVGEAGVDFALAQADGGVERGEAAEAHMDGRHGRARAEGAVLLAERWGRDRGHTKSRITVPGRSTVSLRLVAVLALFVGVGFEVGFLVGCELFGLIGEIADAIESVLERELKARLAGQAVQTLCQRGTPSVSGLSDLRMSALRSE